MGPLKLVFQVEFTNFQISSDTYAPSEYQHTTDSMQIYNDVHKLSELHEKERSSGRAENRSLLDCLLL